MIPVASVIEYLGGAGAGRLREFLERQRWFAAKARRIEAVRVVDWAALRADPPILLLLLDADADRYYVPLSVGTAGDGLERPAAREVARLADLRIYDAHWDPDFGRHLLQGLASGRTFEAAAGRFVCQATGPWTSPTPAEIPTISARPLGAEQSNTSMRLGGTLIAKSFRRPQPGINPDFEITHFLTMGTSFAHVPRLTGWMQYVDPGGTSATVTVVQPFIQNSGDGWTHALGHLGGLADMLVAAPRAADQSEAASRLMSMAGEFIAEMRQLGAITGGLHAALASDTSLPAFKPEPVTWQDVERWGSGLAEDLAGLLTELGQQRARFPGDIRRAIAPLLDGALSVAGAVADLSLLAEGTHKIRCHGDYHLGQVLKTPDGFVVIDFEGEPARPLADRRGKHAPLRDVAGMLRSFNYARHAAVADRPAAERAMLAGWLEAWERLVADAFRSGYQDAAQKSSVRLLPPSEEGLARTCAAFELEKALYELRYELNNRPDWIPIPLAGIARILGAETRHE